VPASGPGWTRIELPGRPNGQTGWVPSDALGTLHTVDGYLRVSRRSLRATLFFDGRAIFSARVGVGKPGTITPAGRFYVMEKLRTVNSPLYGPYAIGTSAFAPTLSEWPGGGVVGIHGTNEPQLIPGRPSHGCIRMRNADISRLWHLIALGTPIVIS
jgi:lipoprotein-anchoring transpeptidase ErfK/SrfK